MVKELGEMNMKHLLLVSFPAQGHVNPVLRFGKVLASHGFLVTFCTADIVAKQMRQATGSSFSDQPQPFGDGFLRFVFFDDGWEENESRNAKFDTYLPHLCLVGTAFLSNLIAEQAQKGPPFSFIINNPFLPWVTDLSADLKIPCGLFWIHSCSCLSTYYHFTHSQIPYPTETEPDVDVKLPFMPLLKHDEIPSFLHPSFPVPTIRDIMLQQMQNLRKASWIFMDSFYELEAQVFDYMSKLCPVKTVGPLIKNPELVSASASAGAAVRGHLFKPDEGCIAWLDARPDASVVYVSLGSVVQMTQSQLDELGYGLLESGVWFLWSKKATQMTHIEADGGSFGEKGKIVEWSPQEEVLNHRAVACTVTHCGWNSTMEAIASGVPVIGYSQWGDQVINSKFLVDVFKMGVMLCRNDRDDTLIPRDEIAKCLLRATVGPEAIEIRQNALKWKAIAEAAVAVAGSSHQNIVDFVHHLKVGA